MTRPIRETVADAIMSAPTDAERRARAIEALSYALGFLVALDGAYTTAQAAYRAADAIATSEVSHGA